MIIRQKLDKELVGWLVHGLWKETKESKNNLWVSVVNDGETRNWKEYDGYFAKSLDEKIQKLVSWQNVKKWEGRFVSYIIYSVHLKVYFLHRNQGDWSR